MSLRFRKSIKIAPGVKVNLNRNSVSTTIGTKGIHYTANSKGTKTISAGIPGSGLSYTSRVSKEHRRSQRRNTATSGYSSADNQINTRRKPKKKKHGCLVPIVVVLAVIFLLNSCLSDDELSKITLSADTKTIYDINTEITIALATEPDDYSLSESDFDISGGTLNVSDGDVTFSADEEGAYTICAKHSDIESNTLTINVEDKEAIAKAEEQRKKEEEAAVKAEEEKKRKEEADKSVGDKSDETDSQNNFNTHDNPEQQQIKTNYVLNKSTKKFHLSRCRDVSKIAEKNYSIYDGSRDDIVSQGYSPCGHCNP
ncbi:MAG: DUF4236 domain-containing protein [Dorea sp.]|jgi:hypothetical protein|nr:DUF4236 domain-containing protein [Dorea sp.]